MRRTSFLRFPATVLAAFALTFTACDEAPTEPEQMGVDGPAFAEGTLDPGYTGQTINIYSGVDADNDGRDDNVDVDPTDDGTESFVDAYIPTPHTAWTATISGAEWIGPAANSNESVIAPGKYPFTTTFTLPAEYGDPVLNLTTSSDNTVEVYLNGVHFGSHEPGTTGMFKVTNDWNTESPFNSGENELKIVLVNAGTSNNPAGLLFSAEITYAVPPVITGIAVPSDPVAIGTDATITASFTDADAGGTHTCDVNWGDGTSSTGLTCDASSGLTASHAYAAANLYHITVTVNDSHKLSDTETASSAVVIYDPSAGFVTGGGWITSPAGAFSPDWTGDTYFVETFDTDPVLAATQTAGAWYVDRYAPAGFESSLFDGDNRLKVTIDGADQQNSWRDYQGRKYDLDGGVGTVLYGDLYVPASWDGNNRHASMWATMADGSGTITAYPIVGVTTRVDGTETLRAWDGSAWQDLDYPVTYNAWHRLRIELTDQSIRFYVGDEMVAEGFWATDSSQFLNVIIQAYNFGETYDVYWDNVGMASALAGKANFGFNAKYKKGANTPDGSTVFNFEAGNLKFHSTTYDWLVVNQNGENAQFKGVGTIDGIVGEYQFMLWAGDHDTGDTFRIKIWEKDNESNVIYDNGTDQVIGGGSIMVHDGKKK